MTRMLRDFATVFYDLHVTPLRGGWGFRERLCRLTRPLVPARIYASPKKLNLGSSSRLLPNYVNVDIEPDNKPDVVGDVERLTWARDDAYDLVRASHILEHFTHAQCAPILLEWRRVLRPGGYLVVCCPDYVRWGWRSILCPHGFDPLSTKYRAALHRGWMSGLFALDLPPHLRHKTVFTESSLRNLLRRSGLRVLGRQAYQVEEPYRLGIADDSCNVYSINLVAQKAETPA